MYLDSFLLLILNVWVFIEGQQLELNAFQTLNRQPVSNSNRNVQNKEMVPQFPGSNLDRPSSAKALLPSQIETGSIMEFADLNPNMIKSIDSSNAQNENYLQHILDINDLTALETPLDKPDVPSLFALSAKLHDSIAQGDRPNKKKSTGSNIKRTDRSETNRVEPQPIPKASVDPLIIPLNINGNEGRILRNPNSPNAVWVETTNSILNTRNSPPLKQNSMNLSPNQQVHKELPNNNREPENPQNEESRLLNNFIDSVLPRGSPPRPINGETFGLSLRNKNMAQLVNGISRSAALSQRLSQGQDTNDVNQPIRGIVVANMQQTNQPDNMIDKQQTSEQSLPNKRVIRDPGKVQNLFDKSNGQDFQLLNSQVMNGLSTGNTDLIDGSAPPSWITDSGKTRPQGGDRSNQDLYLIPNSNGNPPSNFHMNSPDRSTSNADSVLSDLFPGIPSESPIIIDGPDSFQENFVTGVEALNHQNMGPMRDNMVAVANMKSNYPPLGDKEIERLIYSVVSNVDQNTVSGIPVQLPNMGNDQRNSLRPNIDMRGQSRPISPNVPTPLLTGTANQQRGNNRGFRGQRPRTNVAIQPSSNGISNSGRVLNNRNGFGSRQRQNPRQAFLNTGAPGQVGLLNRNNLGNPPLPSSTSNRRQIVGNSEQNQIFRPNSGVNQIQQSQIQNQPSNFATNRGGQLLPRQSFTGNANPNLRVPPSQFQQDFSRTAGSGMTVNNGQLNGVQPSMINGNLTPQQFSQNSAQTSTQMRRPSADNNGGQPSNSLPVGRQQPNSFSSRQIQQTRNMRDFPQTSQNGVTDGSRPVGPIAGPASNPANRESNTLSSNRVDQLGDSNRNALQPIVFGRQNASNLFRNSDVLNRLLQSIDLPKNLPPGQMIPIMILPMGTRNNVTLPQSLNNIGRFIRVPASAFGPQLTSLLSQQNLIENGNTGLLTLMPENRDTLSQPSSSSQQILSEQQRSGERFSNLQSNVQNGSGNMRPLLQSLLRSPFPRISLTEAQRRQILGALLSLLRRQRQQSIPRTGLQRQQRQPLQSNEPQTNRQILGNGRSLQQSLRNTQSAF